MRTTDRKFYQLKIKLREIEPEIWRRIVIPANIRLDKLHVVIQTVMGWENYHLYQFTIQRKIYTEYYVEEGDMFNTQDYHLDDLIRRKGAKFYYLYDFGDHWEHELVVENSRFDGHDLFQPIFCLDGKRACPPEDIGGCWGYDDYCKMLSDPKLKAEEEKYLGNTIEYDPELFDLKSINMELGRNAFLM